MEPQNQQPTEDGGSNKAARWIPTTDHIRILKELHDNEGVRSPATEQIQRICLQLKQYGEIEGKNVFYWFTNQRAQERQKKRLSSDVHAPMQRSGILSNGNGTNWKPEDQYINFGSSASASAVVIAFNGQMGNHGGYGSMNISHNFGSWVGCSVDLYSSSSYTTSMEQQGEDHQEIETLPLFPMHGEDIFGNMKTTSDGGGGYNCGSRTSLELSLNSGYNGG